MPTGAEQQLGPQTNFNHLSDAEIDEQASGRLFYDEDLGVEPSRHGLNCFFYSPEQYRSVHGRCMRFGGIEMDGVLVGETSDPNFKFSLVVWLNTGYEPCVDYVHERDIA